MKVFLAALIFLGIGVFAMCFNLIFRGKEFPNSDVGSNEQMRQIGIRCYKEDDAEAQRRTCSGPYSEACKDCGLYKK